MFCDNDLESEGDGLGKKGEMINENKILNSRFMHMHFCYIC